MKKKLNRNLLAAAALILTSVVYMILMGKINFVEILIATLLAQLFFLAATIMNAFRLSIFIQNPVKAFIPCFKAISLSAGLNLILPFRIAEVVKVSFLKASMNVSVSRSTPALVVTTILDVFVVFGFATTGILGQFPGWNDHVLSLPLIAATILILILRPSAKLCLWLFERLNRRPIKLLKMTLVTLIKIFGLRSAILGLSLTIISWMLHLAGVYLFFLFFPVVEINLNKSLLILGAIILAGAFPALPGGIGVIQAAVTTTLISFGLDIETAFLLAISIYVAEILLPVVLATFIFFREGLGLRSLVETKNG